MFAMQMEKPGQKLNYVKLPIPVPTAEQILIRVSACGICRTDLHVIDGELAHPLLPVIPGHQIIGQIAAHGEKVTQFKLGQRIGVPWLGGSCNTCEYCLSQQENLCDNARYTGYQLNGGFAEYCVANANFCFPVPENYSDIQAAPLLCAGLVGYRAYKKTENAKKIGIYGFGSAGHLVLQIAKYDQKEVYVFTKALDKEAMEFGLSLGAVWAGSSNDPPPCLLDAAIIFAPIGELVPIALKHLRKGGVVVCGGIYMSDIPSFPYADLWGERKICSVANLTRKDGEEFLALAPKIPIQTTVHTYPLSKANQALEDLRHGKYTGSGVIVINNLFNVSSV